MLEYITLPAPLKRSYGNKVKRYGERIVAEAKQESLFNKTSLFYDSVALPSKRASLSSHSNDEMVVNSADPCYDVTNYIHSSIGCHV